MLKRNLILILFLILGALLFYPYNSLANDFDYTIYSKLLEKHVLSGKVDYLTWKKEDISAFKKYIEDLSDVYLDKMTDDEQKAFWINAYNAVTIYGVLNNISENTFLAKVFSVLMVRGFFDTIEYKIAGESLTLDKIENEKLRTGFNDPRVHFAIVCASKSCPKIQAEVFMAGNLDARLDESAKMFIQDTIRNRLDKEKNILYSSQIFKWFSEDFIDEAGSIALYLKKYLSEKDAEYLSNHKIEIKYLYYDWLVNIQN